MALDEPMDPERSASIGPSKPRLLQVLGPGLITGASDDDPSGIATYSQAGAQFGFALCWTLILTYPLMVAVQEISGRVGRTTGRGIAGNAVKLFPAPIVFALVLLLFAANAINIGADLGAMADAVAILAGGSRLLLVLSFGAVCIVAQVYLKYTRYVSVLKWLTLALFAYVATVLAVQVPWKRPRQVCSYPRCRPTLTIGRWSSRYLARPSAPTSSFGKHRRKSKIFARCRAESRWCTARIRQWTRIAEFGSIPQSAWHSPT